MSNTRITGLYKKGDANFYPFGLTGDYVSMHSGLNLERELKIGGQTITSIEYNQETEQTIIYEIYLDKTTNKYYIAKTVIGEKASFISLATKNTGIITTWDKVPLTLLKKYKDSNNNKILATISLYLGGKGTPSDPTKATSIIVNEKPYYHLNTPLVEKEIVKIEDENGNIKGIEEVYSS